MNPGRIGERMRRLMGPEIRGTKGLVLPEDPENNDILEFLPPAILMRGFGSPAGDRIFSISGTWDVYRLKL